MIDLTEFFSPTTSTESVKSRAISAMSDGKAVSLGEAGNKIALNKGDDGWFVVRTANGKVFTKREENALNLFVNGYIFGVIKGTIARTSEQ